MIIKIIVAWALFGLLTNALTEQIWVKRTVKKEDWENLLGDVLRGPIGLAIYIYYIVEYWRNRKNKKS